MKSAYENISDTNTAFGNLYGSCVENGVITNYDKLYNQAMNLYDEHEELYEDGFSILRNDPESKVGRNGMVDAIADIIVFLYGLPHFLGYKYREQDVSVGLKVVLINYEKNGEQSFYEQVLQDTKELIDDILDVINNKNKSSVIIERVQELDQYLQTLCDLYTIDITKLIDRVTLSNMSKLCKNDQEVEETLEFYRSKGVEVYSGESPLIQEDGTHFQVVYSSIDQTVQDKVYREDKFLKCVNWHEPVIDDI